MVIGIHWIGLWRERERETTERLGLHVFSEQTSFIGFWKIYNPFGKFDLSAEFLTLNISLNNGECFPCQFHPALIFATTRFSIIFNKLINLHGYF